MTDDEIKSKQEETLKNLKKYNEDRKTKIVDDPEEILDSLLEELGNEPDIIGVQVEILPIDELTSEVTESEEKLIISHICPYCGNIAYIGQIHGLGYCKEKTQYEQ